MSDIEIRVVDAHDEPQLRAWWETGRTAHVDRPYDFYPIWEFSRVALPADNPEFAQTLLAAYDASGAMVGTAELQLPLNDNTHMAFAGVLVPPAQRRQGVGSALLGEVEDLVELQKEL